MSLFELRQCSEVDLAENGLVDLVEASKYGMSARSTAGNCDSAGRFIEGPVRRVPAPVVRRSVALE
jgi:hypothetical protein